MKKEIEELREYLQSVKEFTLPRYKELPNVDLYMEQVLKYVNGALNTLSPEDERVLTSFMVNNYVKAKMVSEPVKKKYSKDQIGYLIAITLMKTTISMADMSLLLELDTNVSKDQEKIYSFWCDVESKILGDTTSKTSAKLEQISRIYEHDVRLKKPSADSDANNALALLALRLAIQAQANKLLSDYIISILRKSMHGEEADAIESNPTRKQLKHEAIAGKKEAKRVASAKAVKSKNVKRKKAEQEKRDLAEKAADELSEALKN